MNVVNAMDRLEAIATLVTDGHVGATPTTDRHGRARSEMSGDRSSPGRAPAAPAIRGGVRARSATAAVWIVGMALSTVATALVLLFGLAA